ncbi:MAG: alpha/beta hydrolase [Bacteroidia bacterium]|nr:MAG: alpha/beta hydrolase [Bacteroidia bacterium]PIE86498.1 MAG: alpha/beta hydrolase [Bacteroidia bacterium]
MELFFRKLGSGYPLIILHGLYGSSDNWIQIGKKLAEYFEVYLVDQRNHGKSPHHEQHNYNVLVEDLYDFIKQNNIGKAVLIGHSMGGKTVMNFATKYPHLIGKMVVVDISPRTYRNCTKYKHVETEHHKIIEALESIDLQKYTKRSDILQDLSGKLDSLELRQFLLKNVKRSQDKKFYWGINLQAIKANLCEIFSGIEISRFENNKGISAFPALFVKGANSAYINEADKADIKTIFPFAKIQTLKDCGHWLHAEKPEEFIKLILDFVF